MRVERVNERSKSRAQLSPYGKKDWATFLTKYSHTHTQNIVMIMMTWYFIYDIVQNCFTFSMKCHAQLRFSIDFEWKTLELDIFCEDAHVYLMNEVLWRLLMKFEQKSLEERNFNTESIHSKYIRANHNLQWRSFA